MLGLLKGAKLGFRLGLLSEAVDGLLSGLVLEGFVDKDVNGLLEGALNGLLKGALNGLDKGAKLGLLKGALLG